MKQARDEMPAEELAIFDQKVEAMCQALDDAVHKACDPPDEPSPQIITLKMTGKRGRPRKLLTRAFLDYTKSMGLGKTKIVQALPPNTVSARTIRRRALEIGIDQPAPPPIHGQQEGVVYPDRPPREGEVPQDRLLAIVREGRQRFQNFGGQMMLGYLNAHGVDNRREEVRGAIRIINGIPQADDSHRIRRRSYKVAGPNALWHHDGQHCETARCSLCRFN